MSVERPLIDALTFLDVELRRAEPADEIAIARVHVRSWQAAYRGLMPDDYLDQLRPEDRARKCDFGNLDPIKPQTIIATESGEIRVFATTAPAQDSNRSHYGELCRLYVIPTTGVVALASHLCRRRALGFSIWDFECDPLGTCRQRSGGALLSQGSVVPDGGLRTDERWGFKVSDVRYRRSLEARQGRF